MMKKKIFKSKIRSFIFNELMINRVKSRELLMMIDVRAVPIKCKPVPSPDDVFKQIPHPSRVTLFEGIDFAL